LDGLNSDGQHFDAYPRVASHFVLLIVMDQLFERVHWDVAIPGDGD
jgi:hypothetical protein